MASNKKTFTLKNKDDFSLEAAAYGLGGEDLKQYKLSIYSRREAEYEENLNAISTKENKLKEEKDALKKKYGFFGRLFNKRCRAEMKRINADLKEIPKTYKRAKMETQYYVLKEFEEKDLSMSKKEMKTLASIEKAVGPRVKDLWDSRRQSEKEANARAAGAYQTYDEFLKQKEDERLARVSAKKQLDLGDKIHKPKVQEAVQKQETQVEKTVEKEQKVKEGFDLEK